MTESERLTQVINDISEQRLELIQRLYKQLRPKCEDDAIDVDLINNMIDNLHDLTKNVSRLCGSK
ncbi:hypothetical protein [Pseudoalteromonas sp.]|uniref:hypothetical protein n=1 Tax=Pseudoalteromonas sp. TaxID=53249 RepID=UPI002633AF4B|nr:hypothetical protein [Pseudoalteromonas sp.]MCP4585353.1 hypothetical protein [Pseudoalteromonas sp.]